MGPVLSRVLLGIAGLILLSPEVEAQPSGGSGDKATSLCTELIEPNDYNCEEYHAVTDDGFILGIQNMPSPRGLGKAPSGGPPVLLQHGLTAGGDNWVNNNPNESLAFILADQGFDVWIANSRCIQWSHGSTNSTPSDEAFWAWSYDELASYDLKAATQFVYNQRNGMKMSYVGHSLGTTILFAGLTGGRFKTQILGYLNAAVMLAPTAFSSHISAPLLRSSVIAYSSPLVYQAGAMEYSTYSETVAACTFPLINPTLCYSLFSGSIGQTSYTNQSRLGFYVQYFPQPTSTYNYNHLGQGLVKNTFAFYDKGKADNIATYGQATPPNYDLTTYPATLPTQYWTGGIDGVADPTDTAYILSLLPTLNREVHTLGNYGHTDFILGTNAYLDVYPFLIAYIKNR